MALLHVNVQVNNKSFKIEISPDRVALAFSLPDGRLSRQLELDGPSPGAGRHEVPEAEGKVLEADAAVAVVVEVVENGVGVAVLDAKVAAEVAELLLADEAVAAGVAALEQLLQLEVLAAAAAHDCCHHCDRTL